MDMMGTLLEFKPCLSVYNLALAESTVHFGISEKCLRGRKGLFECHREELGERNVTLFFFEA